MKEVFQEVFYSISRHKMRSLLTGFGVAWGMFILIVLLGAGNGFRAGILNMFSGFATNSVWATGFWTTEAITGGMQVGSKVQFNDVVIKKLETKFPQIELIAPEINLGNRVSVTYKNNADFFDIRGIRKDYLKIKPLEIENGRFLNNFDYTQQRRVAVIGKQVKETLFEKENPIGRYIDIAGISFQVVGILKDGTVFSMMEQRNIYTPDVTLFSTFSLIREYSTLGILLKHDASADLFENQLRNFLATEMGFNENDRRALFINNIQLQVSAFNSLFNGINMFLWILGLCFLLSGMAGIMNIMLVVVKERTNEIGIRKALGATPNSIMQLILVEALVITVFFGIIGLLFGYAGLTAYNWIIATLQAEQEAVFAAASIGKNVVFSAFILLVVAGVSSGLFPAQKAAKIMPIETLNKAI